MDHTKFRDRTEAAAQLAEALKGRPLVQPLVLAIPRGGVVLGAVLADELGAELDVALARKLRMPGHPEVALGAVAETGETYLHPGASEPWLADYLVAERAFQAAELARRRQLFRGVLPAATIAGRSVIVTDDGIATGSTLLAALRGVQAQRPHELIVAVPVAAPSALEEVARRCDEVVCLLAPVVFQAVGEFYEDFAQVEDDEVVRLLQAAAKARPRQLRSAVRFRSR